MIYTQVLAATLAGTRANLIAGLVLVSVLFLRSVIIEILSGRNR